MSNNSTRWVCFSLISVSGDWLWFTQKLKRESEGEDGCVRDVSENFGFDTLCFFFIYLFLIKQQPHHIATYYSYLLLLVLLPFSMYSSSLIILLTRMNERVFWSLCIYLQLKNCLHFASLCFLNYYSLLFGFWGGYSFCSCSDPEPCSRLLFLFVFLAKDHFVSREGYCYLLTRELRAVFIFE